MINIKMINKYFWRKKKQLSLFPSHPHFRKLWPKASYYYKLTALA